TSISLSLSEISLSEQTVQVSGGLHTVLKGSLFHFHVTHQFDHAVSGKQVARWIQRWFDSQIPEGRTKCLQTLCRQSAQLHYRASCRTGGSQNPASRSALAQNRSTALSIHLAIASPLSLPTSGHSPAPS